MSWNSIDGKNFIKYVFIFLSESFLVSIVYKCTRRVWLALHHSWSSLSPHTLCPMLARSMLLLKPRDLVCERIQLKLSSMPQDGIRNLLGSPQALKLRHQHSSCIQHALLQHGRTKTYSFHSDTCPSTDKPPILTRKNEKQERVARLL